MLANQGFFSKSARLLNVAQISNIVSRATVIFIMHRLRGTVLRITMDSRLIPNSCSNRPYISHSCNSIYHHSLSFVPVICFYSCASLHVRS
jgi:hypothetical protein